MLDVWTRLQKQMLLEDEFSTIFDEQKINDQLDYNETYDVRKRSLEVISLARQYS
jgi:hypothetical protein